MSNYFDEDCEFNEDSSEVEEEFIEANLASEDLYIPIGQRKILKPVPLVFTIPDNLEPLIVEGYTLAWTKTALDILSTIQKASGSNEKSSVKNLPYASLRGSLEVALKNIARIKSNLGLSKFDLNNNADESEPFAYLTDGSQEEIDKAIYTILDDWMTNVVKPWVNVDKISLEDFDRWEELRERRELLKMSSFKSHILPWKHSEETGTTQARDKYAFPMLADYLARQIAGYEIFKDLGSIKRIISSSGTFTSGVAELITNPINLDNAKGKFSLVVRIEVVTYPSLHQPLVKIDVSKRRWLSQLKSPQFDRYNISGFVFSQKYSDRAFSYKVICQSEQKNSQDKKRIWRWLPDKDFAVLQRELSLPLQPFDGQQIALGQASTEQCQVILTYRNGLQDNLEDENSWEEFGIETGVPEIDKLEAFEAIAKILEPKGIKAFDSYTQVKHRRNEGHKVDDTASREINIFTLLGAYFEMSNTEVCSDFTPKYLNQLMDDELETLLNQNFNIGLKDINRGRKGLEFNEKGKRLLEQTKELKALIHANQTAMRRLYPNERPALWIFYEDVLQKEVKLLQAIVRVLWGNAIKLEVNRLPTNTHGAREFLPGKELKAKERTSERIKAWEHTAKQIADLKQPTFCLILARRFYSDSNDKRTVLLDDKVNKPSTRKALATKARACVQFLEPIKTNQTTNCLKLDEFFHRMQSALKDLLSAHAGRIDDVQEKVNKYLKDTPPEARPKEILAFTIVRKQKGRARGRIENTFLPVAMRLKVDTGKCELCCAYQNKEVNRLEISRWSNFPDALAFIAELSPIKLADNQVTKLDRFMEFVKQIISNAVDEGVNPLVIIDSSNCVQLWSWLADVRMNATKITFERRSGSPLYEPIDKEWDGARLIRIRQDLAPGIIDKKIRQLVKTSLEDTRTKKELKKLTPTIEIPSASSSTGMFKLTASHSTGCVAYLSVGHKTLHQKSRGQSCYHPTQTNTPVKVKKDDGSQEKLYNKAGLQMDKLLERPPFVDRWPTPNPLEIVVTLKQEKDNPDQLATLVESLRYSFGHYSEWTSLPAPLFFERVVRDYISEFAIEDEDSETEQDLEER
ncbi:RNaseH domain-containing protein [Floridanema aerugineum]|uniref:RNaseH domain-containing protein n=1 Tax=Floridaenema aerugineum BLCC-F46 TaxID=3153654 RepID=A0ABV4XE93_9CYAN